jgi:hypothetical protein
VTTYPAFPDISRAFSVDQPEDPLDPTLRDSMENGIETTRARWTRNRRTFSMSLSLLTEDDKAAIDTFYTDMRGGSAYGALPFLVTDKRYLESPPAYLVRFVTLPKYSGPVWIDNDGTHAAAYRWNCTFQVREV